MILKRLIIISILFLSSVHGADDRKIQKVYASNPTLLYQLYALDRSLIAGLIFKFWDEEKKYLDPKTVNLPLIGGFLGQGKTANAEMVLSIHPDLILMSEWMRTYAKEKVTKSFGSVKIPQLFLKDETLQELAESFEILANEVGSKERAHALKEWGMQSLDTAKSIRDKNLSTPTVYYAGGNNGLKTECHTSFRMEIIDLAGGENIHKCHVKGHYNSQVISFEQLLIYNPDIILVHNKKFYKKLLKDSQWNLLRAVKQKKVYLIPSGPFNWIDKPISFMRFLGLKWLLTVLHPKETSIDIKAQMRDFYKLFLQYELSAQEIREILHQ